jgi:hypothetical protein
MSSRLSMQYRYVSRRTRALLPARVVTSEYAAPCAAEQPPVRRSAELAKVLAEQGGQHGRDWDDADRTVGTVLEAAQLERGAGAGPGGAGARAGGGQDHLPAAACREDEVVAARSCLSWASRSGGSRRAPAMGRAPG